ncbi:MAG: class I SAM-dependent methyltransferase [Chloroflexaceae bacterium]|nr:class I SAM-dependent methyltransferase [Chloroflexaceae bacterium]
MSNETPVEQIWGNCATIRAQLPPMLGWLDSPLLQQLYIQPRICGSPDGNWLIALIETLNIARDGTWLSIACGSGGLELFTAQQQLCATIEGVDIAPRAITLAQQHAHEQGLTQAHFRVQILSTRALPPTATMLFCVGWGCTTFGGLSISTKKRCRRCAPMVGCCSMNLWGRASGSGLIRN